MREPLTEHFYRDEFACRCGCGFDTVDTELVKFLQASRDHFGKPHTIISGCRCPEYNSRKEVGGKENSQHLYGRAADYVVEGVSPDLVQDFAEKYGMSGIGFYTTFTHVDSRSDFPARWWGEDNP